MAKHIKDVNQDMARKFLEKEKSVGKMMAAVTTLTFLVFISKPILRGVHFRITFPNKTQKSTVALCISFTLSIVLPCIG